MFKLAIFASGSGSNAENIIKYFQDKPLIGITCVCTNNADAKVIERAGKYGVPVLIFSKSDFYETNRVADFLTDHGVDWIILAGFLWLVPQKLIDKYHNRIINIHPALLPKFGGKGMYGARVHKAVIEQYEPLSGITIHYVDHKYDNGSIIFQATCKVDTADTPDSLAAKVHELEYEYFPKIIEQEVLK